MEFDFNRYVRVFNTNDEDLLGEFFTEDVVVEGPDRVLSGRREWLGMLKFMHAGVQETLSPIMVVREGDNLMVETNAVFTASADRHDHLFGPLKAGQPLTMRFFGSYRLRGHQISHLALAWWPPDASSV